MMHQLVKVIRVYTIINIFKNKISNLDMQEGIQSIKFQPYMYRLV